MDAARWWAGAPDRSNRSHLASRPGSLVGRELPGSGAEHPATRTTGPATRGGRRQHFLPLTYVALFNSGQSTGKVSLWQLSSCPCLIGKICSMEQSLPKAMPLTAGISATKSVTPSMPPQRPLLLRAAMLLLLQLYLYRLHLFVHYLHLFYSFQRPCTFL